MSAAFDIHASEKTYRVAIAVGLAEQVIASAPSDAVFMCDAVLRPRLSCDPSRTIVLEANEITKDLDNLSAVMAQLKKCSAERNTMLYAIGGGVVQDVACFVASVYMRGVPWVYMPTTLLGMVDSCIGGKSSINAGGYKNLVGTFHPPEAVHIDPNFASSLSAEQKVAGLCEAVKICCAHTGDAFTNYLALSPNASMDAAALAEVICLSLTTKKWFIEIDEFDRNERQLLNFGHTFGHAIEAATDFAVSHGVAVGIGMLIALNHVPIGGFSAIGKARIALLRVHTEMLLSHVAGLRDVMKTLNVSRAVEKFTADKKHTRDCYWIIAANKDGLLQRVSLPKTAASLKTIETLFLTAKDYAT